MPREHPINPVMDELFNVRQLAEMFQVTDWSIRQWVKQGKLQSIRLNNRLYFTEEFISDYANGRWGSHETRPGT